MNRTGDDDTGYSAFVVVDMRSILTIFVHTIRETSNDFICISCSHLL